MSSTRTDDMVRKARLPVYTACQTGNFPWKDLYAMLFGTYVVENVQVIDVGRVPGIGSAGCSIVFGHHVGCLVTTFTFSATS